MITRYKPAAPGCSERSWRELLLIMNSHPARIVVLQTSLDEVLACHVERKGIVRLQYTPKGRKYYIVDRLELFAFVQEHGDICEGKSHVHVQRQTS